MIASAEQGALSEFQTVQITVDASGLTESGDETDVLKAAETTHVGYGDIVKEYVEGKVQAYIDTKKAMYFPDPHPLRIIFLPRCHNPVPHSVRDKEIWW